MGHLFTSATAKKARCRKGGLHAAKTQALNGFAALRRGRITSLAVRKSNALSKKEKLCPVCENQGAKLDWLLAQLRAIYEDAKSGVHPLSDAEKRIIFGRPKR